MIRLLSLTLLLALLTPFFIQDVNAGVYEPKNIVVEDGELQLAKSGQPIFFTDFSDRSLTPHINDYGERLNFNFGSQYNGVPALVVSRKEIDPNDPESYETAWEISTDRLALDSQFCGAEFVLRLSSVASKSISGGDDRDHRGRLIWFDQENNVITKSDFLFRSEKETFERSISGIIPEEASFYEIRLGFDDPNLEFDDVVALFYCSLEIIDSQSPYPREGSFFSDIFTGGRVTWNAEIPEGGAIKFQISTAESVDGLPSEFSPFIGPDGTEESYYEEPFETSAPFFRYKVLLVPNLNASPTLRSVSVDDRLDNDWKLRSDLNPPRVRLVGARSVPNPSPSAPIQFEITDDSIIIPNTLSFFIDDSDVPSSYTVDAKDYNRLTVTLGENEHFEKGLHKVLISVSDVHQNNVETARYFLVEKQKNAPLVSVRQDGMVLIDNEPFFPIGIYGVNECEFNGYSVDKALRDLKKAGFNFVHSYSMWDDDRFLDAAEKYGLKVWSSSNFPEERFMTVERFSPAIIAWYLGDDTAIHMTPSELFAYHNSVKAVDPTRLTVQATPIEACRELSYYRPYVEGTDAFLPEIYPVYRDEPDISNRCVAQTVLDVKRSRQDALEADDGPKSIWPIIQYFQGWGFERFPTYRELRAMSFAALANGANGITWFTYDDGLSDPEHNFGVVYSPETWRNISTIATQIKELIPVLLAVSEPSLQPTVTITDGERVDYFGNITASALLKELDGDYYLIVVNSSPEPIEAQFESPVFDGSKELEYVFVEDSVSTPEMKDGILSERIEGFGVRVYRW